MNKRCFFIFFGFYIAPLFAQKWDNNWPGGLNEFHGSPGSGNYLIHFESGSPKIDSVDLGMNFESAVASLSDSTGKLLIYTNGCCISAFNGQILSNGDGLNPGEVRDSVCPKNGYIAPRGVMFIPMPGLEKSRAILLHMGVHYDAENRVLYGPFYSSIVDLASNSVIEKNKKLIDLVPGPAPVGQSLEAFSVVRHGNGRDWWVVVPELGTNHYHTFLLDKAGISEKLPVQEVGPALGGHRPGSTVFSPDGRKYARSHNHAVVVMDFDRCAGEFKKPILFDRPTIQFGGGGLAFSPNGKQLVVTAQEAVLSADLSLTQPTLDTVLGYPVVYTTSLGYCQLGPDSNLYFSSMQRLKRMPVLKNPFGPPQPTDYSLLSLPVWNVRSVPYFPNFRLYDFADSPCDTLGTSPPDYVHEIEGGNYNIMIFPNPSSGDALLIIPEEWQRGELTIFSNIGEAFFTQKINDRLQININVSNWPQSLYSVEIKAQNQRPLRGKLSVFH